MPWFFYNKNALANQEQVAQDNLLKQNKLKLSNLAAALVKIAATANYNQRIKIREIHRLINRLQLEIVDPEDGIADLQVLINVLGCTIKLLKNDDYTYADYKSLARQDTIDGSPSSFCKNMSRVLGAAAFSLLTVGIVFAVMNIIPGAIVCFAAVLMLCYLAKRFQELGEQKGLSKAMDQLASNTERRVNSQLGEANDQGERPQQDARLIPVMQ